VVSYKIYETLLKGVVDFTYLQNPVVTSLSNTVIAILLLVIYYSVEIYRCLNFVKAAMNIKLKTF